MWTKEQALEELQYLINEVETLYSQECFSTNHSRWITRTETFLEEVFGCSSKHVASFRGFPWRARGRFVVEGLFPQEAIKPYHREAYLQQLSSAKGLLLAVLDELRRKDIATLQQEQSIAESNILIQILNIVDHKLRKTIRQKPLKEREIQDAFETLLIASDIPYLREKETIEYSSKYYIPDFTFPHNHIAIDLKLFSQDDRRNPIIGEINDDILAYQTKYQNLIFIVYDLGCIRDIEQFIGSFEEHRNVIVRVVKH